jgi:hypothetical protein
VCVFPPFFTLLHFAANGNLNKFSFIGKYANSLSPIYSNTHTPTLKAIGRQAAKKEKQVKGAQTRIYID